MESPYWNAVRHGKPENWYRASGAFVTVFRHAGELYRSDCRRRTSEKTLRRHGWMSGEEFLARDSCVSPERYVSLQRCDLRSEPGPGSD
jgi:hypothetical protein